MVVFFIFLELNSSEISTIEFLEILDVPLFVNITGLFFRMNWLVRLLKMLF